MSGNRQFRKCRQYRPRQAAVRRELTLHSGADLACFPPLIRIARCATGKVQYFAAADAELALAGIDRSDPRRREQRVYHCPVCEGWHLTSQDPRIPKSTA
ncbi:hypothetical protein [Nocardia arizonensis]|uniref:hypothetical protein n=1 Tax=Nocardia arizonensis TaxID=1141647 RepID=UPI0006CFAB36|nr:hypothetical protein [Nocardia arizonensis]